MSQYQRLSFSMAGTRVPLIIFVLALFIGIEAVTAVTVARAHEFANSRLEVSGTRYCDFSNSERMYNITDLLLCMNELASSAVDHSRNARSSQDKDLPPVSSGRAQYPNTQYQQPYYNYLPRPGGDYQSYYARRPSIYYPGSASSQGDNSGYYRYTPETPFGFAGGAGAGLFDALTSISQYDDLKCVPRLLCEVATGVVPGNSDYKQSYDDFGGNALIRLLTALDIGGSSPLLAFGKSALTGYTSRGNPGVCYKEYPRCPRNNADLVNYLNNHNGGFFRFFGNNRGQGSQSPQGNYYRRAPNRGPAPPPGLSGPNGDRTGTGELKFDSSASLIGRDFGKSFFPERGELNESNKIIFPQEPLQEGESLNRVSKSLSDSQGTGSGYQNPSFFPQDRKGQETNILYGSNSGGQTPQDQPRARSSQTMESPKARLYRLDDPSNETTSSFTFPDGQKVKINVAFSKLFSEGYKKALRRSFADDDGPQTVNFEGFSMVNLAELYPNDKYRLDLQVVHPCDMICHDSKGTPVQFNQILLHSGSLSTLMAPDQPILDLSIPLPCEVMCIDRRGERRRLSTTLNQVLRNGNNQPDFMGLQDNPKNQEYQWLNGQQRRRNLHNREVKAPVKQTTQFSDSEDVNKPPRSIDESQQRVLPIQEQHNDHQFGSMPPDYRETSQPQSQLHAQKSRDTRKTDDNANSVNVYNKAASMPEGSIIIGGGPMPFFGPPMPFMGIAAMSPGGPAFLPQGASGPLGLAMPSMQSLSMPPDGGIVQSFGMMPMFPGMMPMMDPLSAPMASMMPVSPPPSIVCSDPSCSPGSQSPTRTLTMCGGVLYFIPYEIFVPMPVCAVCLESGNGTSTDSGSHGLQQTSPPIVSSTPADTNPPGRSDDQVIPIAETHKYRHPEGEDYPQVSCLEGQSWNLDVNECVPIKYDKDIDRDYIHLPGSPWSGVTRKPIKTHKLKKRKKLVIITDKGNITYIKAA